MKTPKGYLDLAAKRLPILLQIKALEEQLDDLDKPYLERLQQHYAGLGWNDPKSAAENELKRLHKSHALK